MNPQLVLLSIILVPLIGSVVGFVIGKKEEKRRDVFNIIMTGINFLLVTSIYNEVMKNQIEVFVPNIMGVGLYFKLDMFRYIFVWLTTLIWFLITIYSTQYLVSYKNRNRYYAFFMITYWSTLGVFISNNFINLFTFFEIMSLASYPLIIHDEDQYSHEAGKTYLIMAVAGGLVLLMGIFLLYDYTLTLNIDVIKYSIPILGNFKYIIAVLILFGFGIKAGMFPLYIWLPKAHPAAPAPASAILSGILLKTGIFGILITTDIMGFNDNYISVVLLVLGFITMFMGGFLAMFQRNIKRILAYSSMSQMGYIIVGIGLMGILHEHKAIALYGVLYHIINHMIFKVLLFMSAGVIYMKLHELSINGIGGVGRNKKALAICFFIGSAALMAMPGFSGFISKNLLHHALAEAVHLYGGFWLYVGEVVFVISSSFTAAYLLKLFVAVFVEKSNHDIENIRMKVTGRAKVPMAILAGMIVFIGVYPQFIMKILDKAVEAFGVDHPIHGHFYSFGDIKSSAISILLGTLIYVFFIRKVLKKGTGSNWWYVNPILNWFSLEKNLYIPVFTFVFKISSFVLRLCDDGLFRLVKSVSDTVSSLAVTKEVKVKKVSTKKLAFENPLSHVKIPDISGISDHTKKVSYKINSITYAVYIFGTVLVICLGMLLYLNL